MNSFVLVDGSLADPKLVVNNYLFSTFGKTNIIPTVYFVSYLSIGERINIYFNFLSLTRQDWNI